MRAPFPLSLRIGTDIVATNRILCPSRPNYKRLSRLAARFLHPRELDDLNHRFPNWEDGQSYDGLKRQQLSTWLAGRWAAKEAAKKAWDATLLSFRDLRVEAETGGRVQIICDTSTRLARDPLQTDNRITEQAAQLSISHDGEYTIATVMATPLHHDISAELAQRKSEAEARLADK
ncbi:hypothetical protein A1O1_03608 [Capronia coronata CBS 617.96]|uniref:4'-phosphopantetheinyl transferase domain-containing protein n=1 Tax=Capronia coronata CBS 617.96 TaxID=1182541 RepID=W9YLF6_9EURO|nr:uncharacterized protein A1O1_03608 [Capronia coronata CBS 617.96]EXJ90505.1 hypothetical protein A1O1_03608 [Capronia coronata CBS 617.96]